MKSSITPFDNLIDFYTWNEPLKKSTTNILSADSARFFLDWVLQTDSIAYRRNWICLKEPGLNLISIILAGNKFLLARHILLSHATQDTLDIRKGIKLNKEISEKQEFLEKFCEIGQYTRVGMWCTSISYQLGNWVYGELSYTLSEIGCKSISIQWH